LRYTPKGLLSLLNFVDELSRVVASLAITDLLARTVVAHQDVELAGGVAFSNWDVIWLTFATEAQRICTISVLHWIHFIRNVGLIVKQATISIINGIVQLSEFDQIFWSYTNS
jgi:hypothetical protein